VKPDFLSSQQIPYQPDNSSQTWLKFFTQVHYYQTAFQYTHISSYKTTNVPKSPSPPL